MHPLKEWRKSKGYTQQVAAKKIGCSLSTYINWEYFLRNPSPRNIKRISTATDGQVTVDKLFLAWEGHHHPDGAEGSA